MIQISYTAMNIVISCLWILVRLLIWRKTRRFSWKRELELLLVYICLMVVSRFTLFPFSKVNGQVQPLNFDPNNWFPFHINLLPLVYLFDYEIRREAWINVIGNTAMFIPIGIIWPSVFRNLDTAVKVIAAGVGFSLCIEIFQLPFFERTSDIDDLILNSLGYLIGYGICLLVKQATKNRGA
jgi:glycopeptide antibiotics resistance protein